MKKGYLPDFYLQHKNGTAEWVEIKGKLDPESRQKINLFRQQVAPLTLIKTGSTEFFNIKIKHKPKLKQFLP